MHDLEFFDLQGKLKTKKKMVKRKPNHEMEDK